MYIKLKFQKKSKHTTFCYNFWIFYNNMTPLDMFASLQPNKMV